MKKKQRTWEMFVRMEPIHLYGSDSIGLVWQNLSINLSTKTPSYSVPNCNNFEAPSSNLVRLLIINNAISLNTLSFSFIFPSFENDK